MTLSAVYGLDGGESFTARQCVVGSGSQRVGPMRWAAVVPAGQRLGADAGTEIACQKIPFCAGRYTKYSWRGWTFASNRKSIHPLWPGGTVALPFAMSSLA